MKRRLLKISVFVMLMFLLSFTVGINNGLCTILLQDNFNLEHGGVGILNYNGFTNWTVTNGTVDLIGNGYYDFYPGNGLYVDLDGSTSDAGILSSKTKFHLTPGIYELKFDLGGNHRGGSDVVHVSLGLGDYNETFTMLSSDPLGTITRLITIATTIDSYLVYANDGGDNVGAILDNVTLQTAPVPEPATMLLLGSGLIGLVGYGRRRFLKK